MSFLDKQEEELKNKTKIIILFTQLCVAVTLGIILSKLVQQSNTSLLFITIMGIIFLLSYVAVGVKKVSKFLISEKSLYLIAAVELILTIVFSIAAYDISKRFSPLVVKDIKTQYIGIFKQDDVLFTLSGFSVDDIRSSLSGQFKELLVGSYYTTKTGDEKIVLESVLNQHQEISNTRPIFLNLNPLNAGMTFGEQASKTAEVMITFNPNEYANMLYLYAEDYVGNKEYILYVLSVDGNRIACYPVTSKQVNSRNALNQIYNKIAFDTDLFWKNTKVRTFEEFQEYVVNRYKQLKQVIED